MSLPDFNTAYNTVFASAHQNVFFNRLQSHGIVPQSEKEAQDLLLLAANIREQLAHEKQAASRFSAPLSVFGNAAQVNNDELMFKQAAAQLASDPNVYNSVLALAAHEAANVA